jgi:hypothetical protein
MPPDAQEALPRSQGSAFSAAIRNREDPGVYLRSPRNLVKPFHPPSTVLLLLSLPELDQKWRLFFATCSPCYQERNCGKSGHVIQLLRTALDLKLSPGEWPCAGTDTLVHGKISSTVTCAHACPGWFGRTDTGLHVLPGSAITAVPNIIGDRAFPTPSFYLILSNLIQFPGQGQHWCLSVVEFDLIQFASQKGL